MSKFPVFEGTARPVPDTYPCNCIGPQNGEPMCPCRMRGVIIKDGRYVQPEIDLGPVKPSIDIDGPGKFEDTEALANVLREALEEIT